jgi:hypothetical protein
VEFERVQEVYREGDGVGVSDRLMMLSTTICPNIIEVYEGSILKFRKE